MVKAETFTADGKEYKVQAKEVKGGYVVEVCENDKPLVRFNFAIEVDSELQLVGDKSQKAVEYFMAFTRKTFQDHHKNRV